MTETPHLSLPLLAAGQAQKHVTHNDALMALDVLTQLCAISRCAMPPGDAQEGDRHLVDSVAGGAFASQENRIAWLIDGEWRFLAPQQGWRLYLAGEDALLAWTGNVWRRLDASVNPAALIGVNATADTVNRLAVKSQAVLFSHDEVAADGNVQVKINKAAPEKLGSLLFQTAWSGRIELGTIGDDSFSLRSSSNGTDWTTRLSVQGTTGRVGIGVAVPAAQLDIRSLTNNGLRLSSTNTAVGIHSFDSGGDGMSPICDFDVMAYGTGATATFRLFRTLNTTGATALQILRANGSATANSSFGANTHSYLNLGVGNVGIGTASPSEKLTVAGHVAPASDNLHSLGVAGRRWSVVHAATGVIATSDMRQKTAIEPSPLGLDFVRALTPRIFRWSDAGAPRPASGRHLGFVAQEVKAALDAAGVDCGLWSLDDPADPESGQSLRYDQFIAPLVAAVQDVAARLETLEARAPIA